MNYSNKECCTDHITRCRSRIPSTSLDDTQIYNKGSSADQRCKQRSTMPVFNQRYTTYAQRCYTIGGGVFQFGVFIYQGWQSKQTLVTKIEQHISNSDNF